MFTRTVIAALSLAAAASTAQAQVIDCGDPANASIPECAASDLPVPTLATNAAPLLALPLVALGLSGGGGGGGTSTTTTSTTGTN